jgi:hypothetical protein
LTVDVNATYYLLLADVRGSTAASSAAAMERLEATAPQLSVEHSSALVLGLTLSYGDEVAGLFSQPGPLYSIMRQIRDVLLPDLGVRFVVIRGRIGRPSTDIRKVGGEVFKRASTAMEKTKRSGHFCYWDVENATASAILTTLTEMTHAMFLKLSPYQREIYFGLRGGQTQSAIAGALGKYKQSVSEAVGRGNIELLIEAERLINSLLASQPWLMDFGRSSHVD